MNLTKLKNISVVIVNWNSGTQVASALTSIANYGQGLVSSVVVVDNASTDDSMKLVAELRDLSFELVLISNSKNEGFGRACNLGAHAVKSDFLLFLNPDAALYFDTISKVMEYMQDSANATVGICGTQLVDEDGRVARSCARFPTIGGLIAHASGLDRVFHRLGPTMREWDHAQTRYVDQVIGAFFLVRSELFEALCGFDERFFVYFEEVDFSYRARLAGWRCVYLAEIQAFHSGGGTSNQVKAQRLFYSLRSRLLYSFKHFSWFGAIAVLLATLLIEPLSRTALALLRCSWAGMRETWAAYSILCRWLSRWMFSMVRR